MPTVARPVRVAAATAAAVVLTVGLGACSNRESAPQKRGHTGTASASAVAGVQQLTVLTGADLRFHPSTLIVHPGTVRIVLKNTLNPGTSGGPPHNLLVSGLPGAFVPLTSDGQTGEVTFTANTPGRYRFVCTIHEAEGQTGVLVVERA